MEKVWVWCMVEGDGVGLREVWLGDKLWGLTKVSSVYWL